MSAPTSPIGEMLGYPKLELNEKGTFTERCLKIKVADSAAWINYFMSEDNSCPYFTSWGYNLPPILNKIEFKPLPSQKISSSSNPNMPGTANYEWGLLYLWYDTNFQVHDLTKTIVKETLHPDFETVSLDGNWFRFAGGFTVGNRTLASHIPGDTYRLNYPFSLNSGRGSVAPGSINSDTVSCFVIGVSFPPNTLMYTGCEINSTLSNAGYTRWNKTYTFKSRPYSWNKFYNTDNDTFTTLLRLSDGGNFTPYTATAFTGMFT